MTGHDGNDEAGADPSPTDSDSDELGQYQPTQEVRDYLFGVMRAAMDEEPRPIEGFPPDVAEQLGYYVYLLTDPRMPEMGAFYIGNGTGNRVFAHAKDALAGDEETPKVQRIREILDSGLRVGTEILRSGLDERTALEFEAASIELLGLPGLLNQIGGHGSERRGRMSTDDVIAMFAAQPVQIDVPAILIKPSRLWYLGMPEDDLLDATAGWWRLGPRRQNAQYAFAVVHGVVRGVWRVEGRRPRREGDRDWQDDPPGKPRWGFAGSPAPELHHLLFGSVSHYWKRGAQSPFVYVNC